MAKPATIFAASQQPLTIALLVLPHCSILEVASTLDPLRAASGPFGTCIAHGYLTQSLANLFMPQLMTLDNMAMGVNYGSDRVRFPAPVRVGARVRGHGVILRAESLGEAVQVVVRVSVEIEGESRPGCVVDTISRYYPT